MPVGEDQAAHVELTREVARRFNNFYKHQGKPVFPEPEVLLTPSPKLLGTDRRKMSKSYGNSILLSDEAAVVEEKIKNSVTDRPKLSDRGSPDRCPVGNLHQIFSDRERLECITRGCTTAGITCVECKSLAVQSVNAHLEPIRQRRKQLAQHPERLQEVIQQGAQKAGKAAEETMAAAREAVGLLAFTSVIGLAPTNSDALPLRASESVTQAKSDEERWEIQAGPWLERVSKTHPLTKDRPRTFITRRKRKVGVHTASEIDGSWTFRVPERPVNVLVLIAQDKDRFLHDYVLPPKVVQESWKQFARNGESVEIIVKKAIGGATMVLASSELSIQQYEGNYTPIE